MPASKGGGLEDFVELWRGVAYPWECDHMGHVNVQHYASKMGEASLWLAHLIGLSPAVMTAERRTLAPVEDYYRFRREVHGGDVLVIRGAVLDLGETTVTYVLEMVDAATGEVCTTNHAIAQHVDLATGAARPWSDTEQRGGTALRRDWDGERGPRSALTEPALATRSDLDADRRAGCIDSYRGAVQAWECDRFGRMPISGAMARFSAAVWHFGEAIGVGSGFYRAGNATAGLYYHIRTFRPAFAGDVLLMVSGLTEHGETRHRYLHKLYDAATDALIASTDTIGVNIDGKTRRPAPWPEEVSAKSRARLVTVPA
jgi:acyl-CoA thioester hydrolase